MTLPIDGSGVGRMPRLIGEPDAVAELRRELEARLDGPESAAPAPEAAVAVLCRLLEHPDCAVRAWAAAALGGLGRREVVADLVGAALRDVYSVRRAALTALVRLGGAETATALAETAVRDTEADLRALAVRALGDLPHPEAERALHVALADECEAVRLAAVRSIARLGTGTDVPIPVEAAPLTPGTSAPRLVAGLGNGAGLKQAKPV